MRKRLTGAGHTVHALRDVGTTPVSAIMRAATFCDPDEPLRLAAGRLGQNSTRRCSSGSTTTDSGSSPTPTSALR